MKRTFGECVSTVEEKEAGCISPEGLGAGQASVSPRLCFMCLLVLPNAALSSPRFLQTENGLRFCYFFK